MKEMVGEQIWERFFQGVDVTLTQYVPFQLGGTLITALAKAEAVLKKCAKLNRFAELRQEDSDAKRLRTGRYAPSPY